MNKGMALISVLIIVLLLFALIAAFLLLTTNARLINERYHENLIALGLAEAGVDFAIREMNFGNNDFSAGEGWSGANPKTITKYNFADASGNIYGDIIIFVYNPWTAEVTVISEGVYNSISGPTVSRKVRVVLVEHKIHSYAILTADTIDIGGNSNKIDSYNSSLGPYGGANVGDNGDIITNGAGDPAISLRGGATIEGDANTGPSGTVTLAGSATLSGTTDDTADVFMPPVVVPQNLANSPSLGGLSLAGQQSLELTTGDYKYDSLSLSAQAVLTLNGDVNLYLTQNPSISIAGQGQIITTNGEANIYFDGDASLAGQGVSNQGGNPADLTFFGTDSVSNINLAGIGEFYGTFYAPESDYFYISGNSEVFGAVVGKNVSLTGSATIHFDEYLQSNSPTMGYHPTLWQEKD